jgi:hypothetical protein
MTDPFVLLLTVTSKKNITMENWWNDDDREERYTPKCHFVLQNTKSRVGTRVDALSGWRITA